MDLRENKNFKLKLLYECSMPFIIPIIYNISIFVTEKPDYAFLIILYITSAVSIFIPLSTEVDEDNKETVRYLYLLLSILGIGITIYLELKEDILDFEKSMGLAIIIGAISVFFTFKETISNQKNIIHMNQIKKEHVTYKKSHNLLNEEKNKTKNLTKEIEKKQEKINRHNDEMIIREYKIYNELQQIIVGNGNNNISMDDLVRHIGEKMKSNENYDKSQDSIGNKTYKLD